MSHVRAVSDLARLTLADATRRSPTVSGLIARLQMSDVIVFVDTRVDPDIPTAETMLMVTTGSVRYVHVVLNPRLTLNDRIEYLGHELQHAVEIAGDRAAVDGPSIRRRFGAIGRELSASTSREKAFETDGARLVSLAVRRDLASPARGGTAPH